VAEKIELESKSNAKKGLQMAINDFVKFTGNCSPEKVTIADARFKENVITLSEVRRRYSKKYLKTL
jgi:hypothetical protein